MLLKKTAEEKVTYILHWNRMKVRHDNAAQPTCSCSEIFEVDNISHTLPTGCEYCTLTAVNMECLKNNSVEYYARY